MRKDYPSITPLVVRDLLSETREKGYCVIPGIMVRGYWGLSVPLLQQDGRPIASMILVTTEARLNTPRQVVLGERMRRLAHDLMVRAEHRDDA